MDEPKKTINDEIADLAMLQFTDREIATIMQTTLEALLSDHAKDIDRGRLLAEAEVRKSVLQLARQGSTPAQKQFMEMNDRAKRASLKRNR